VEDGLDAVRALVPGVPLESVEVLGGSDRSRVRRVRAGSRTLIVKEFTGSDEGWVRESAALSVLPSGAPAPRFVAAGRVPPMVVMSDVGPGDSVAEALLGPDPAVAADAVMAWVTALAVLHRATTGSREAFRDALHARAGQLPVPDSTMSVDLEKAAGSVARHCADLGVDAPAQAWEELRALATRLDSGAHAALTPADACPDNNVRTGDGLVLIDFEDAQWRHVAWDVAYLIVPWPSCWCAWRIPAVIGQRAIDAYQALSGVDGAQLRRDVDAAVVGWAFLSLGYFLPRALRENSPLAQPDKPAPTRRAVILHRLDQACRSVDTPALAELAARLHHALTTRWGDLPLPYAPAFDT
jgi:hypothetical protein